MRLLSTRMLMSIVPGHEGYCQPTWVNRNQLSHRLDGGVSGFFRLMRPLRWFPILMIRSGPEFHGIVRNATPDVVQSTATDVIDRIVRQASGPGYYPAAGDPDAQPPRALCSGPRAGS